jgi:predicted nucleic acid-binding protein
MALCLDASVVVPALLPRPSSPVAAEFVRERASQGERFVAPPLVFAESTSVLRRYVHFGEIEHQEAVVALGDLVAMPITIVHDPEMYLRALELARRLGQPKAYDVQYLAVAELQDCPVVTLDRGLYESARSLGIAAHLLS